MTTTTLRVSGLCCADEVATLERELSRLEGVSQVRCNLVASTVTVEHDPSRTAVATLVAAVDRTGMRANPEASEHAHVSGGPQRGHLISTVVSGVFVAAGLAVHWLHVSGSLEVALYAVAMVAGGWFIAPKALRSLRRLSPDMNLLMCIAVVGAAIIRAWDEAATVIFLFSLAELLESFSLTRARRAIASLMTYAPATALLKRESSVREVPVGEVAVGDVIVIRPGARIPLDGVVIDGTSSVNQAPITGESMPVEKKPGSDMFAGSINERGSLEVRVSRLATDSTLARIIHLVEEAQSRKAPSQRFVDTFAHYYTPIVLGLAGLVAVVPPLVFAQSWSVWFYRALVTLVVGCPCALVISTPVAIVSGLTAAARAGVLIKGGSVLEALGRLRALAMDKTGTITEGRPRVTDVVALDTIVPGDVLRVAAALEAHSEHPVAQAIRDYALAQGVGSAASRGFESLPGRGVEAEIDGHRYFVGNHRLVEDLAVCSPETERRIEEIERRALTAVVVGHRPHTDCKGEVLGVIAVGDTVRPRAAAAVRRLRRAGLRRIVILSGDNRATTEAIAKQVDIAEVVAELLPEEKVERLRQLVEDERYVGMVGDGVNDAPALAAATVGIAMGVAGTDAALEAADVALMADDLDKMSLAITLGRRTERIIRANITLSILTKAVFLGLAGAGIATLWMAVAADTGATLVVIGNSLRLLKTMDRES